ncbi:MAG: hypothetical protein HY925_02355 [Elusimicrobia bacterium]|nr:hypothetical protein [Elusimicrobiota bacterium]
MDQHNDRFHISIAVGLGILVLALLLVEFGPSNDDVAAAPPKAGVAASVSLPRLKPGDPVLLVSAPAGTAAVVAKYPFGKTQLCAYDPERKKWVGRFLVPRNTPEGRYTVTVAVVGRDGSRTAAKTHYVVDKNAW